MNLHDEFLRRVAADRLCRELARAIAENDTAALERLGMRGFGRYAGRLSELMTDSVRRGGFSAGDFAAIMGEVASPARYAHHLVNEGGTAIQQALDKRQGIRLRVIEPEFNDGRLKGIVGEASGSDSENAADNLAVQLGTMTKDAGNEFMRQNAEQRSSAGFKVTITRTGGAKCCPWCADRTGTWELKAAPDGVFGVHDNCKCMVDYTNSKGTVRGRAVTHKIDGKTVSKWEFADKITYTPPRVLTKEEAAKKGGFDKPRRLTANPIGNYAKVLDLFNDHDLHEGDYSQEEIREELSKSKIGREILSLIPELGERIKLTYGSNPNVRGFNTGQTIEIYVNNCKNVTWVARTIIHEVTHYHYGIGGSQWAECVCIAQELKHARNRDYLTIAEKRAIINAVKSDSDYGKLNWRKGGTIYGRRQSHK
jgi:predicted Zn-dependent protease with MMP-like domain